MNWFKHFLALIILMTFVATAQSSWENKEYKGGAYQKTILQLDSAETINGDWFNLNSFLATDWASYPPSVEVSASVPTTGTPKIVLYLQSSFSNATGFVNVDTLASTDSTLSTTATRIYPDYNGRKYPFYRWAATGQSTNPDSVTLTVKQFHIVKP